MKAVEECDNIFVCKPGASGVSFNRCAMQQHRIIQSPAGLWRRRIPKLDRCNQRGPRPNFGMKAQLMTMDALVALPLFAIVLMVAAQQSYAVSFKDPADLRALSMSVLASYEKSGLFARTLTNHTELRVAMNSLPAHICAQITIMDENTTTILDAQKENCADSRDKFTLYRTFYSSGLYAARMRSWYG